MSAVMGSLTMDRQWRRLTRDHELHAALRAYWLEHGRIPRWQQMKFRWRRQFLSHYLAFPPEWRLKLRSYSLRGMGDGTRVLPDFAVVGPPKSASSDLAVSLLLHPNIMCPIAKECRSADPGTWRLYNPTQQQKTRHARRFGAALVPFLTPILHMCETRYNLARAKPDCRIIIPLRDPVARLYSHWKFEVLACGRERARALPYVATFSGYVNQQLESFPDAVPFMTEMMAGLQCSIYWRSVKSWIEDFGAGNVLVLDVGEYHRDRNAMLRRIHEFLGLPVIRIPDVARKVNENPLELPPPDEASLAKLRAFFKPYNQRLWEVIEQEFAW